jgi:hypothetical protein
MNSIAPSSQFSQAVSNKAPAYQSIKGTHSNIGISDQASTNGLAIASLVTSLFGLSLLAVIFGQVAISQVKKSKGRESGEGLAVAGLVIGWLGMVFWIFIWIGALSTALQYY